VTTYHGFSTNFARFDLVYESEIRDKRSEAVKSGPGAPLTNAQTRWRLYPGRRSGWYPAAARTTGQATARTTTQATARTTTQATARTTTQATARTTTQATARTTTQATALTHATDL
jgi:hypothetical protein